MKIKKHIVGLMQANCYVVWDEDTGRALVIDPGGNARKIARTLSEKGLKCEAIIHTHSHWDHTAASAALQRLTGAPVFRHPEDARSGLLHRMREADGENIRDLHDGQELTIGSITVKVMHTPGHSRGGVCLYLEHPRPPTREAEAALFSGDLLFKGSVGRWDLRGGSFRAVVRSLNEGLAALPDDTAVYPGHGPATNLGQERRHNQFFETAREIKRQARASNGKEL